MDYFEHLKMLWFIMSSLPSRSATPSSTATSWSTVQCRLYTNTEHWVRSFTLVRNIVGGINYKGVREIMKNCIEKASLLPSGINSGVTAQSESL